MRVCSKCGIGEEEVKYFTYRSKYGNNLCGKCIDKLRLVALKNGGIPNIKNKIIIKNNVALIECYTLKGEVSEYLMIDKEDIDLIKDYKWFVRKQGYKGYGTSDTKGKRVYLHNVIMNPPEDKVVDHINRDKTDNRKENLRIVTQSENNKNVGICKKNKSGVIGVGKSHKRWYAELMCDRKRVLRVCFKTKEEAIKARLQAEVKYYGEFAPQRHLFEQYNIKEEE